jgi:hypothetical protein
MSGAKGRLLLYAKYKNLSARTFAASLNLSSGYFTAIGSVSSDILESVGLKYPDLNLYWVIMDKGEMINEAYRSDPSASTQPLYAADIQEIINLKMPVQDTINILRDKIVLLIQEINIKNKIIAKQNDIITRSGERD